MQSDNKILLLDINLVVPNKYQPRKLFDETELNTLAESIKEYGILNPILVRQKENQYEIIAGERRYRAAKMAGLTTIPVIIKSATEQEMAELALIENIQRRDLSPIEEAKSYEEIIKISNQTQDELAKKIGKSQSSIANKIRLLTLPNEIQEALINRKISERHARSLLTIEDREKQISYLNEIIDKKLTVKETEQMINQKEITEEEIKSAINDIMRSLNIEEKEEKDDDNMNNGNFFPNYNNDINNNTSLNMMNMQSMGTNYVEPQPENIIPTPNIISSPMNVPPLFNESQMETVMPTPNIISSPMNVPPMYNEPQVEIPQVAPTPFDFNTVVPTPQIEEVSQPMNTFINPQTNLNTEFVEQPAFQPTYINPVESSIIQEQPTLMQDTPLFNPTAFEVPVANETFVEQDKLSKLQELLNQNGYMYKVYSNETDNCVIIELPKN